MDMNKVFDRFIERSPLTVMARIVIQRAINADWVDEVFEQHRQQQYTRALMFSTVVDLMSLVALGMRPSLHAAARAAEDLPVSLTALYDKVNRAEPAVMRALVQGSAERLGPVISHLRSPTPPWLAGYRIRVVDGNHLPGSEKRLAVLREVRGAALPGLSLVVYDPEMGLVVELEPCEDGHSNERTLMRAILETAQPGEVWLADRNFCTRSILGALAQRGASFLIREHRANVRPTPRGLMRQVGRVETGMVYEQRVEVGLGNGQTLAMRRIELRLDQPTQDGETSIRLLVNLPGEHLDACEAARLYRRRWTIEGMFQRLESVLNSEIRPLGYPRAALLAFAVAIVAYQVLVVLEAAVAATHDLESQGIELSTYYLADEVKRTYEGMMVALPEPEWRRFDHRSSAQLAKTLGRIAAHVKPRNYRKNPRKPKVKRKPGYVPRAAVQRHVATARILRDAGRSQGP